MHAPRCLSQVGAPLPLPDLTHITFKVPQKNGRAFTLGFPKGQTVKNAQARVSAELERPPDDITLLFSGKAFKDTFVLDRLRIGKLPVTLVIQEISEVQVPARQAMQWPITDEVDLVSCLSSAARNGVAVRSYQPNLSFSPQSPACPSGKCDPETVHCSLQRA